MVSPPQNDLDDQQGSNSETKPLVDGRRDVTTGHVQAYAGAGKSKNGREGLHKPMSLEGVAGGAADQDDTEREEDDSIRQGIEEIEQYSKEY